MVLQKFCRRNEGQTATLRETLGDGGASAAGKRKENQTERGLPLARRERRALPSPLSQGALHRVLLAGFACAVFGRRKDLFCRGFSAFCGVSDGLARKGGGALRGGWRLLGFAALFFEMLN